KYGLETRRVLATTCSLPASEGRTIVQLCYRAQHYGRRGFENEHAAEVKRAFVSGSNLYSFYRRGASCLGADADLGHEQRSSRAGGGRSDYQSLHYQGKSIPPCAKRVFLQARCNSSESRDGGPGYRRISSGIRVHFRRSGCPLRED